MIPISPTTPSPQQQLQALKKEFLFYAIACRVACLVFILGGPTMLAGAVLAPLTPVVLFVGTGLLCGGILFALPLMFGECEVDAEKDTLENKILAGGKPRTTPAWEIVPLLKELTQRA